MLDMEPTITLIALFLVVVLVLRNMNRPQARNSSAADNDRLFRAED
jgi:preprotein translocase subunit SecG